MRFEKLITQLKKIREAELKQLHAYLHSPYFNEPKQAIALFNYLQSIHRSYAEKHLSESAIKKKEPVLRTQKIQDKAGSQLLTAIANFKVQQSIKQQPYLLSIQQLKSLKQEQNFKEFEIKCKQLQQQIDSAPEQNIDDFEARHHLAEIHQTGYNAKTKRHQLGEVTTITDSLEVAYAVKKMRYDCELLHRLPWVHIPKPPSDAATLLQILQPYNSPRYPYLYLFLQVYQLLGESCFTLQSPAYKTIKDYLNGFKKKPFTTTAAEVNDYAASWALRWFNLGYRQAGTEYLHWMELKRQQGLLIEGQYIQPVIYRNMVAAAVQCNVRLPYIKKFIEEYTPALPPAQRNYNHAYTQGLYLFAAQKFNDAASNFYTLRSGKENTLNAVSRRWYFMSAYEHWTDHNALDTELDTFRKYIDNHIHELKGAEKAYRLFVKYSRQLLKAGSDKKLMAALHKALQNEIYFPGKWWLQEKSHTG